MRTTLVLALAAGVAFATPAFCADGGAANNVPPGEGGPTGYADPFAGFNQAMFTFNLKLDQWVLRPIASGYARIAPEPVRKSVGHFFDNANVIPRVVSNLCQLKLAEAGSETARFGINSVIGVAGFFDPAKDWFGIKPKNNDTGLTLRYYHVSTGPYLMLPFFGPSTIGDALGTIVDGSMNPVDYLPYFTGIPTWLPIAIDSGQFMGAAINYRSLHLNQFEEADRYAVDLYGAVQDGYLQTRAHKVAQLRRENM
ncbi:MAG: MlaA family lipoprotein [Candidatus Binataceae bacterium]